MFGSVNTSGIDTRHSRSRGPRGRQAFKETAVTPVDVDRILYLFFYFPYCRSTEAWSSIDLRLHVNTDWYNPSQLTPLKCPDNADGSNPFGTRLKWPSSRQKAVFLLNLLDGGAAFEWRGREVVRGELKPHPASAFIVTVVEAGHPNRMNPFFSVYPAGFQGRSGPRDDVEALVSILTTAQQFHAFGPPARSPNLRSWDDLVTVCFKELDFVGKDMPLRLHHFLSDFIKKFGDHPLHLMRLLRPPYLPFDKDVSDVVHRMQPGPAEWNLIKGHWHELTTFFSENIQVWCSIIVRSSRDDACPARVQCAVYAFLIRALLKGAATITRETFPEDYDPALLDPDVLEEVVRDRSPGTSAVASLLVEVWPASILQEKVEGLLVSQGGQERLSDLLLGVLARLQKVTRDVDGLESSAKDQLCKKESDCGFALLRL